jgi:hypothetical protein
VLRRILAACVCAIALAGCRLDVSVDVAVEPDGSGTVSVVIVADGALVAEVPTIADELATDDIVAAGWSVSEPTPTPDGGLSITLSHEFSTAEEATNLLNSLGPPFGQMSMTRESDGDRTTTKLSGLLGLPDGFDTFADPDLVAAVGAVPFADRIAASGATPETSMSAVLRASLPGEVDESETNGTDVGEGVLEWTAPLDGTILDMRASSTQAPGDDRWWARPLSILALVALVAWVVLSVAFIGYVIWARLQRTRRRPPRPSREPNASDRSDDQEASTTGRV